MYSKEIPLMRALCLSIILSSATSVTAYTPYTLSQCSDPFPLTTNPETHVIPLLEKHTLTNLSVRLKLNNTNSPTATLTHQGSTNTVILLNGSLNCSKPTVDIHFDDNSANLPTTCQTNLYKPLQGQLNDFKDLPINGDWNLTVNGTPIDPTQPTTLQWCLEYTPRYQTFFKGSPFPPGSTLDFGEVTPKNTDPNYDTPLTQTFTILNTGNTALQVNIEDVSPLPISLNSVEINPTSISIPAGGLQDITIALRLSDSILNDPLSVPLKLTTNEYTSPTSYEYLLSSTIVLPKYVSDPGSNLSTPITFRTLIGTMVNYPITIKNEGKATLEVAIEAMAGNVSQFIIQDTNVKNIPAGQSSVITISCAPLTAGSYVVTLGLISNDINNSFPRYTFECIGLLPSVYESVPNPDSTINMGDVHIGDTSADTLINVNTKGGNDLSVYLKEITGDKDDFTIEPQSFIIPKNSTASQPIIIACAPTAAGHRTLTITWSTNDPSNKEVTYTLTCNGKGPIYASTPAPGEPLNFGSTPAGLTTQLALSIKEKGNEDLEVNFNGIIGKDKNNFKVISPTFPINISDGNTTPTTITIACTPSQGENNAQLELMSNDPTHKDITYDLICTGAEPKPVYHSEPNIYTTIAFGKSFINTSIEKNITIENRGSAPLIVTFATPSIIGEHADDFNVINVLTPLTLPKKGDTQVITLACKPKLAETHTVTFVLATNDPEQSQVAYHFTCIGVAPSPPQTAIANDDTADTAINTAVTIPVLANDIDGLDALFANYDTSRICLGNKKGNLSACKDINKSTFSLDVATGDLNNDWLTDVLFANDGKERLCFGNGKGSFTTCTDIPENTDSKGIALGDINADGKLDAVFANLGQTNRICLNNGAGNFTCNDIDTNELYSRDVALGDVDNDGDLDAIFANNLPHQNVICLNDGTGHFVCNNIGANSLNSYSVALSDLNSDGKLDAVFGNNGQKSEACLGDGSGNFNQCSDIDNMFNTVGIAVGDINGDNAPDVVLANYNQNNRLCLNLGIVGKSISFKCAHLDSDIRSTLAVSLADMNDDGRLDVLFANENMKNQVCLGDETGNINVCLDVNDGAFNSNGIATGFMGLDYSSVKIIILPNHGEVGVNIDGSITYTPEKDFIGEDILSYEVDGASAKVTIAVNDADQQQPKKAGYYSIPVQDSTIDLGDTAVNVPISKDFVIGENGNSALTVELIAIEGNQANEFEIIAPQFPVTINDDDNPVKVTVRCKPMDDGLREATLKLQTNDTDKPLPTYSLTCRGQRYAGYASIPKPGSILNFSNVMVGDSAIGDITVSETGNADLKVDIISFDGPHASDFTIVATPFPFSIADGDVDHKIRISCVPSTVGVHTAILKLSSNAPLQETLDYELTCTGIEPAIQVLPSIYDFGTVRVGSTTLKEQEFVVTNAGNFNVKLNSIAINGVDVLDFRSTENCLERKLLRPDESCKVKVKFIPVLPGHKQATLTIMLGRSLVVPVPLSGMVGMAANCSEERITLQSSGVDVHWDNALAWVPARVPVENDIVRINTGHTLIGLPFIKVSALCLEAGSVLKSPDVIGQSFEIQATEYIENNGKIIGQHGTDEIGENACTRQDDLSHESCAQPGASILLKVGNNITNYSKIGDMWWESYESGGPVVNRGDIIAGDGGKGYHYGAAGGDVIVLGRNTDNTGMIKAGKGGDIVGVEKGEGGKGGLAQIWGKLGGKGYLHHREDAVASAGSGGDCNPNAIAPQRGGKGGNLWLVSLPDVYIEGVTNAGKVGEHCNDDSPYSDGFVRIEPNTIELSGAHTVVNGGDIAIYGGDSWVLDLSDLNHIVVDASGNIVLAVGKEGIVDLRGNHSPVLKAAGRVDIFADTILLDEDVKLADVIQSSNIVVSGSKILRDVALVGTHQLRGEPGEKVAVHLLLMNNGPDADTYTLTVVDEAGWVVNQLPPMLPVAGLDLVEMVLEMQLPAVGNAVNNIMVTAASNGDPSVKAVLATQVTTVVASPSVPVDTSAITVTGSADREVTQGAVAGDDVGLPVSGSGKGSAVIACPATGVIDYMCSNRWHTLKDAMLEDEGNVVGGELAGTVRSKGVISQVTIQPGAVLKGGRLTGYIVNKGTIADVEFVGAEVQGGVLAGVIVNSSAVGGVLRDVHFAAGARVRGGQLAGRIEGDESSPVVLEYVEVKADSRLTHVVIGPGVKLAENVIFDGDVEFEEPEDEPVVDDGEFIPEEIDCRQGLPGLGATMIDSAGNEFEGVVDSGGGIAVDGGAFQQYVTQDLSAPVEVRGSLCVVPEHSGQEAELVVYAAYKPLDALDSKPLYYMLDEQGSVLSWDEESSHLVAFGHVKLGLVQEVSMYRGRFIAPGALAIYFGYRLSDGTVVVNAQSINVAITEVK